MKILWDHDKVTAFKATSDPTHYGLMLGPKHPSAATGEPLPDHSTTQTKGREFGMFTSKNNQRLIGPT
ncbi:hypothetical protein NBRC116601_19940 [Cognatishimia sp. WU-CL00825]|uniref:hypothetical protein n=1 Tax=Cognatishimia sp. WU-CL00825 TaxID=3127658 RepID=UPI00310AF4AD